MTYETPFRRASFPRPLCAQGERGVDGSVTMRDTDHTIINYPVAWSHTVRKPPYLEGFEPIPWEQVLSSEAEWKKQKGYA